MEEFVHSALLFDFYGELLTPRQKDIYKRYNMEDHSLNEIADSLAISKQGVYDSLKRTEASLNRYEEKLSLVKKFDENLKFVQTIKGLAENKVGLEAEEVLRKISKLSDEFIKNNF